MAGGWYRIPCRAYSPENAGSIPAPATRDREVYNRKSERTLNAKDREVVKTQKGFFMAKIDITQIDGYESMTPEEKVAALEAYDVATPDMTKFVPKSVYDKAASDAAAWKKKVKESQTEDEKKAEAEREKDEELKALKRRVAISDNAKSFLKSGYDADNAEKAATALYDGDNETFFTIQQSVMESARKSAIADKMNKTPDPDRGEQGTGARDYEKEIETAKAAGDFVLAASLMTQQYQENQNNGGNS